MQRSKSGFSLIEVVVAMGVLIVAILATLAALSQSANLRQASSETEAASQALEARMAVIRSGVTLLNVIAFDGTVSTPPDRNLHFRDATLLPTITCEILNESEASLIFRTDLDKSGTETIAPAAPEAGDHYDLDSDLTPGEVDVTTPGDTTTGSLHTDYTLMIPVRLTLVWPTHTGAVGTTRTMVMHSMVYPVNTN